MLFFTVFMQPAFFFGCIFPPPATCAEIFAGSYGAGTGLTTDAYKTTVMQRVIGHIIFIDKLAYLLRSPMQNGIVLDHLVAFIPFDHRQIVAIGRMFGA